jgi:hypothetical protein
MAGGDSEWKENGIATTLRHHDIIHGEMLQYMQVYIEGWGDASGFHPIYTASGRDKRRATSLTRPSRL